MPMSARQRFLSEVTETENLAAILHSTIRPSREGCGRQRAQEMAIFSTSSDQGENIHLLFVLPKLWRALQSYAWCYVLKTI